MKVKSSGREIAAKKNYSSLISPLEHENLFFKFNYVRRQITLHQPAIRKLIVLHSIVNNFSVHFRPRLSSSKSLRYKRIKLRWEFVGLIVLVRMSLKLKVAVLI